MQLVPETIGDVVAIHIHKKYSSRAIACDEIGISQSFLTAIIKGDRQPPAAVLEEIGYRVAYVPEQSAMQPGCYVYVRGAKPVDNPGVQP